ncbi:MAG TPA: hypothetical protein VHV31_09845, partial [Nitrolancea sp.]|nr:hypothetical protein [Nitrolancea sp.]
MAEFISSPVCHVLDPHADVGAMGKATGIAPSAIALEIAFVRDDGLECPATGASRCKTSLGRIYFRALS